MLVPIAVLVAYEAGLALFRAVGPAVATAIASVALATLAPGHGGAYTALALPATASRQILVPAALALAIGYVASPSRAALASTAAAGLALAVVHPTYALFLWLPFARLPRRPLALDAPGGAADRARARRPRRAGRAVPALAPAGGSRHRLALAGGGRDRARAAPVRRTARRPLGRSLLARAAGVRAERGGRGGGAPPRAARRVRVPPALGRLRRRRLARGNRRLPRAVALHALLGCRLALAVPSGSGLRAVRVRLRGRARGRLGGASTLGSAGRLRGGAAAAARAIRGTSTTG